MGEPMSLLERYRAWRLRRACRRWSRAMVRLLNTRPKLPITEEAAHGPLGKAAFFPLYFHDDPVSECNDRTKEQRDEIRAKLAALDHDGEPIL